MRIYIPEPRWGNTTILRQTSQYSGITDNGARYFVNPDTVNNCDYILIGYGEPPSLGSVEKAKLVYPVLENPKIWRPDKTFLENVDIVITPYDLSSVLSFRTKQIISHTCVPWFYGISFARDRGLLHHPLSSRLELDAMKFLPKPRKSKLISIIASNKGHTRGHRWRRELAAHLHAYFGDQIDIFGFGHNPISDKREATDKYAYSIVIENDARDFYVTEKIVDSLLGWSYPIYSGSPMIEDILGGPVTQIKFGADIGVTVKQISKIVSSTCIDYDIIGQLRDNALSRLNLMSHVPKLLSNA
jgi:hypothetical protein